jgi:hypothetical protein
MTITAPAISARALAPETGSISGTPAGAAKAATEDPTASNINAVIILIASPIP